MKLKIKLLVAALFLVAIASAAETTWRHSGFEVASFDINLSGTFNITELRLLEWGWNTSTPSVSNANRARMYYDDNNKRMMQSIDGGNYEPIVTNVTVNPYTVNATNLTTGVLPNASIPLSALNRSEGFLQSANESNISVAKQGNGSYRIDLVKDEVGITNSTMDKNLSSYTGVLPNASIPLSAANLSSANVFTSNVDVKASRLLVEYPSTTHRVIIIPGTTGTYHQINSDYGAGGGFLPIRLLANPDSYNNQMVLDTNGNIGIRNTTPGYNLTIGTDPWLGINAGGSVFTISSNVPIVMNGSGLYGLNLTSVINVTQNYTIGTGNTTSTLYTCHANSGTLNITLPTGVVGTEFSIKKKDATGNICSVFSSQKIDGASYANISTQYNSIDVIYTSDEWSII